MFIGSAVMVDFIKLQMAHLFPTIHVEAKDQFIIVEKSGTEQVNSVRQTAVEAELTVPIDHAQCVIAAAGCGCVARCGSTCLQHPGPDRHSEGGAEGIRGREVQVSADGPECEAMQHRGEPCCWLPLHRVCRCLPRASTTKTSAECACVV